ncbi:MAG: hypothetical protein RPU64_02440 [Candidatus Sedimenticola sp. (ex Thyasira tokunagai)]
MKKSQPLLIALIVAFALALLYNYRSAAGAGTIEVVVYLTGVLLLVLYGLWWIVTRRIDPDARVSKMPRGVKAGMASFLLVWGLMLLIAVCLMPFVGASGFFFMVTPWAPILWIVSALLLLPFVQNRLQ